MKWFLVALLFALLFKPLFLGKTLYPANLQYATYIPWKNEPVAEYPNGPSNKPIGFDNIRQFLPNRKILKESILQGILPLWNPYIYSGTPFMASFDTAVFYPLSWIAAFMPLLQGWNFLVVIQPILSFVFMYLFLKSLAFEERIRFFGAFVYTFSGWMVVYWQEILVLEHSFLWLPLALYASNRRNALLLAFSLVCSVFAGFLQMSIYVYIVVLAWNLFYVKSRRLIGTIVASLGIASIQLIPSIESFLLSPRGTENGFNTFQNNLLPLKHLATFIAPDFWGNPAVYNYFGGAGFYFEKMIYFGSIPFIFFLYALLLKDKHILFWKIGALISLSGGFALYTSWLPYVLKIPVLSNSYPTRIFAVFTFCAVTLACYGLRSFFKSPHYKRFTWILVVLVLITGMLWTIVGFNWILTQYFAIAAYWCGKLCPFCELTYLESLRTSAAWYARVSLRNLFIPTFFLLATSLVLLFRRYQYIILCFLTILPSIYFAHKYLFFSEAKFAFVQLPVISKLNEIPSQYRIWGFGDAYLEKNIWQYYRWFSTDGYGNLSSIRYGQLLSTIINNGKLGSELRRSDTDLFALSQQDNILQNTYRLRMMSVLGVKYIVTTKSIQMPDTHFNLYWEDATWRIWEYKYALPRVYFASQYIVEQNDQSIIDTLYNEFTDIQNTVILEKDPNISNIESTGSADIQSVSLNAIDIRVTSSGPGLVVFTDNFYPGWKAYVDGQQTEILRANYSFKGVAVVKGEHTVRFSYEPVSFRYAIVLSAISLALVIYLNKKRKEHS